MQRFKSWPYWVHLIIDTIVGQALWWGISELLKTPVEIQSIIAGIVLVATIFAVAWYLPKILKSSNTVPVKERAKKLAPTRLEHDGVLWEDGGRDGWGSLNVIGPLCPKDFTPLAIKRNDKVDTHLKYDTTISNSGYHSILTCPECNTEYNLGEKPKTIQSSHDEVLNRFKGKRNRE
jgi:hypothetical protein